MAGFDLVIFDCDGTLVDSETLNNVSTAEVLTDIGLSQYTVDYSLSHFVGRSMPDIWNMIEREIGQRLPADINQRYIDRVARNRDLYLKPAPGAADVVGQIAKTHRICVASNGELPNVQTALAGAGLASFFSSDQVFVADMVSHAKPAPDLFLYAAKQSDVAPERTLVIEDSLVGATAGLRAGMTVFGYTGLAHDQNAQNQALKKLGVHYMSDHLSEILQIIGCLPQSYSKAI